MGSNPFRGGAHGPSQEAQRDKKKVGQTSPDQAPSILTLNICDDPIPQLHRPPTRHLFARCPRGAPDPSPGDGFWPRHRQHTPDRLPLARRFRRDKLRRTGSRPCPVHSPTKCSGDDTRDHGEYDGDRGGREAPALPTRWSTPVGDTLRTAPLIVGNSACLREG